MVDRRPGSDRALREHVRASVFPIAEPNRLQNVYTVAFFRRHLFEEDEYDAFLTSLYADTEPAINFQRK